MVEQNVLPTVNGNASQEGRYASFREVWDIPAMTGTGPAGRVLNPVRMIAKMHGGSSVDPTSLRQRVILPLIDDVNAAYICAALLHPFLIMAVSGGDLSSAEKIRQQRFIALISWVYLNRIPFFVQNSANRHVQCFRETF